MLSSPPEPFVPRGKIAWDSPKETRKEDEVYTPRGKITWGEKPEHDTTVEPVSEDQSMQELDEALAREDSQMR